MWVNFEEFIKGNDDRLIEKKASVVKQEKIFYCNLPDFSKREGDITPVRNVDEDY